MRPIATCIAKALCVLLLSILPAALHAAERFPEPGPPRVDRGIEKGEVFPVYPTEETPATEWTFHKTPDNRHPDGNEQQFLWLMNRARANPADEGIWLAGVNDPDVAAAMAYFNVNTVMLKNEFSGYAPRPPAAFDARLYAAALSHSSYLIAIDGQNHDGQFERVDAAGFVYTTGRGNVFSYSRTALYGHAAFNIDWGDGTDGSGMQDGRGHRMAVMAIDGDYTNAGIAAVSETNAATSVGPMVVTGNYCNANEAIPNHHNRFLVGTVWKDGDGDGMYDPGEGINGVTVKPDHGPYFAVTGLHGGYAIPILAAGDYQVQASGGGLSEQIVKAVNVGTRSVLLDFSAEEAYSLPPVPKTKNPSPVLTPILLLLLNDEQSP